MAQTFRRENLQPWEMKIYEAIASSKARYVENLLSAGALRADENPESTLALRLALFHAIFLSEDPAEQKKIIKHLQTAGADINALDPTGKTILMHAVAAHDAQTVKTCLQVDSLQVNVSDKLGWTALAHAVFEGCSPEIILSLLKAGARPSREDWKGRTILTLAYLFNPASLRMFSDFFDVHIFPPRRVKHIEKILSQKLELGSRGSL